MRFRTEINIQPLDRAIRHSDTLFSIGSCFAESIAAKLSRSKFRIGSNPFGVLYNPFSIASAIESLASDMTYTQDDLSHAGGVWFSYAHHGSFSSSSAEEALRRMNDSARRASQILTAADLVIVTFGTAWAYEFEGQVVANCHKQPASQFRRRRLSVEEIVERFSTLLEGTLKGTQVIFTVSPVRHLKDGFAENSLSKSILRVAVGQLVEKYAHAHYFPAFEIVNDDLRDYRFYKDDMVHPSDAAVDYVWEKFSQAAFGPDTLALLPQIENLHRAMEHRPFDVGGEAYVRFRETSLRQALRLQHENPAIDFSQEVEFFGGNG